MTDALKNDLLAAYDDQLRGTSETADVPTEWRGKGIYKALVAVRAARAVDLGYKYLHVDASTPRLNARRGTGSSALGRCGGVRVRR